jgi:type IV secretory pathway VirJ component
MVGNETMQFSRVACGIWLAVCIALAMTGRSFAASDADTLQVGQFGTVHLYRPDGPPRQMVIFLSGDAGWQRGVVAMAEQLRSSGALVAGIDTAKYFQALNASAGKCVYLGADFERLSRLVQQTAGMAEYHYPILAGYSSGASLVYAVLNQTPKGTFAGGVSLGFCPDLDLAKPLCKGEQLTVRPRARGVGVDLLRVERMNDPWIVLHGERDRVCDMDAARIHLEGIQGASFVNLPRVGHGYSAEDNWVPQFLAAYRQLSAAPHRSSDR